MMREDIYKKVVSSLTNLVNKPVPNQKRGTMGYLDTTEEYIIETGTPNMVYVTTENNVIIAINAGAPLEGGHPVIIEYPPGTQTPIVRGSDTSRVVEFAQGNGGSVPVSTPYHTHRLGTGLEYLVQGLVIEPGLVAPTNNGLEVKIYGFTFVHNGVRKHFDDQLYTPTAPPTSDKHRLTLVGVDPTTDPPSRLVVTGSEVADSLPLTLSDAEAISFAGICLAAIRIKNGQTSFVYTRDFMDTRNWAASVAGMEFFTLDADTGDPETITNGDTLTIAGDGTTIDTVVQATDTVVVAVKDAGIDTTQLADDAVDNTKIGEPVSTANGGTGADNSGANRGDILVFDPDSAPDAFLAVAPQLRNALPNGAFRVLQRGSSFTLTNSTLAQSADTWFHSQTGDGVSDELITFGTADGFPYIQIEQSRGLGFNGGVSRLCTILTPRDMQGFAGQSCTLSFEYQVPVNWTAQWTIGVRYDTDDSTINSAAATSTTFQSIGSEALAQQSLDNETSWTPIHFTFTLPSDTRRAAIVFYSGVNAVDGAQFRVRKVQFTATAHPAPFLLRSLGDDIALCEERYQKSYNLGVAPGAATQPGMVIYTVWSTTVNANRWHVEFCRRMRAAPTVTIYSVDTGASGNVREIGTGGGDVAAQSQAAGESGFGVVVTGTPANVDNYFRHQWTASAEP